MISPVTTFANILLASFDTRLFPKSAARRLKLTQNMPFSSSTLQRRELVIPTGGGKARGTTPNFKKMHWSDTISFWRVVNPVGGKKGEWLEEWFPSICPPTRIDRMISRELAARAPGTK